VDSTSGDACGKGNLRNTTVTDGFSLGGSPDTARTLIKMLSQSYVFSADFLGCFHVAQDTDFWTNL
jgi:hypothetical protein